MELKYVSIRIRITESLREFSIKALLRINNGSIKKNRCLPKSLPYSQSASDVDPAAEIMSSGQLVHDDAPAPL